MTMCKEDIVEGLRSRYILFKEEKNEKFADIRYGMCIGYSNAMRDADLISTDEYFWYLDIIGRRIPKSDDGALWEIGKEV